MRAIIIFISALSMLRCQDPNMELGSTNAQSMQAAMSGVYTSSNRYKLKFKHTLILRKNSFFSKVKKTKKSKYNLLHLINTTKEAISFPSEDGQPRMIQEAMDEQGNWRPIEYWEPSTCGNSYMTCILPPDHYNWFKIRKYTGDYPTKLRVKYKIGDEIYYSPTYNGHINTGQFVMPDKLMNGQFLE